LILRLAAILAISCLVPLARPAQTTAVPKKKTAHSTAKSAKATGVHAKSTGKRGKAVVKRGTNSRKKSAQAWRSRQLAPTPDRYKEIQTALVTRGYLKSQPSGVWDAQSGDALKHFQHDQNLEPNGKLNSLSLIALGLGAKHPPVVPSGASPAPAVITPRAPAIENPAPPVQNAVPPSPANPEPPSSGSPDAPR